MNHVGVSKEKQENVLSSLQRFGYTNCIKGIRPYSLEGKIVSDADMCDAMGANGILRTYQFGNKFGRVFFNKKEDPNSCLSINKYNHF